MKGMKEYRQLLVNSWTRSLDSTGMNSNIKTSAAKSCELWSLTISKFRRTVGMEITIEDIKARNTVTELTRLKTAVRRRVADETKGH